MWCWWLILVQYSHSTAVSAEIEDYLPPPSNHTLIPHQHIELFHPVHIQSLHMYYIMCNYWWYGAGGWFWCNIHTHDIVIGMLPVIGVDPPLLLPPNTLAPLFSTPFSNRVSLEGVRGISEAGWRERDFPVFSRFHGKVLRAPACLGGTTDTLLGHPIPDTTDTILGHPIPDTTDTLLGHPTAIVLAIQRSWVS